MRVLTHLAGFAVAATTALSCAVLAQETTDQATLDPKAVEALFPKPGLLPLRRQYIPDPSALR